MDILLNQKIKVTLNSTSGFITYVGKLVSYNKSFLCVETTLGPIYIAYSAIKTVQLQQGGLNETK